MTKLELIIKGITGSFEFIPEYDGCLIIEYNFIDKDKKEISETYFKTISEFHKEFEQILHEGFSWVNVSLYGIYKKKLLICIETPEESKGVPYEHVALNTSGPFLDDKHLPIWEVSKIYKIIQKKF